MVSKRKFNRKRGERISFRMGLASSVIERGKITTTVTRAKDIRPLVERYITIAKKNNLASFRLLLSKLPKKSAEKIFYEIAPKYKDRDGGYLRITKTANFRKRDAAQTAVIELV